MKCPRCGNETGETGACSSCGWKAGAPGGMEVEYRDFKVSELLDIRLVSRESSPAQTAADPEPPSVQQGKSAKTEPEPRKVPLWIAAAVVALAAAALFFFLRFLPKF